MNLIQRVAASIFRLSEDERTLPPPEDDFWYSSLVFGTRGQASLQATAVFACVRVIAETIGSLPCSMFERVDNGKQPAREHPLHYILHDQANDWQTSTEYFETVATHLCTAGNSYSVCRWNGKYQLQALEPLEPQDVTVLSDKATGRKAYRFYDNGVQKTLFDGDILHIPGLSYDGKIGYSPLTAARRAVEMSKQAEEYAANVFENSAIPPAYVQIAGATPDASATDAFKKWWHRQYGGKNRGSIAFTNGEIKTVNVNHRDLQFLELRKFQLEEIARIYRVPLHLVQSLDRSTNNNIEHQSIDFAMHTIRPWLVRLEKRINMVLLGPREGQRYFAEFNMEGLLRGDSESRSKLIATYIQNGVMTPDEARGKENLNPRGGASDKQYIQGATVPLEMAGQPPQQTTTQ